MEERECKYCGKLMYAKRKTKLYCSAVCKSNNHKEKENEKKNEKSQENNEEIFYPQVIKNNNYVEVSDFEIENNNTNLQIINNNQMSDLEARQIQYNGSFIRDLNSILNHNNSMVKVKLFKTLINVFIRMREDYIESHSFEYSQYLFLEDLEVLISDLVAYFNLNIKKKTKSIYLDFGYAFVSKNKMLIQKLKYYNMDLREKYL